MPKISVLFTTNKLNQNHFEYLAKAKRGMYTPSFNEEFTKLLQNMSPIINHFIDTTLCSLIGQTFKDFEVIISHRYPEDIINEVKQYNSIPIKLVREKPSIWHDLGPYNTVANNKNTAIIHSTGELLFHIDDFTLFNENVLQEAWDLYKEGKYLTSKTYRCIEYNQEKYKEEKKYNKGQLKIVREGNGWYSEEKPLTLSPNKHQEIPMNMFWTCGATVSRDDMFKINGYDEVWDGSLCGLDMDAGDRLAMVSNYKRVASKNYIYEINDFAKKTQIRDDVIFRQVCKQSYPNVTNIIANSWKPNKNQSNRYKYWHEKNNGLLDINWDKYHEVPFFNLREEYAFKRLGEVIYHAEGDNAPTGTEEAFKSNLWSGQGPQ
jgi:hypothetical protein